MSSPSAARFARIRVPHVFVLLTFMVLLAALATYVVPSGRYQRVRKTIEGRERTLVIPGTYAPIPKAVTLGGALLGSPEPAAVPARPVSFLGFLSAIPRGMVEASGSGGRPSSPPPGCPPGRPRRRRTQRLSPRPTSKRGG